MQRNQMPVSAFKGLLLASAIVALPSSALAQDSALSGLNWLGTPGPDYLNSYANDVSADGSVVVGSTDGEAQLAMRWTQDGGMIVLGNELGEARAVSGDGESIVGYHVVGEAGQTPHVEAFLWTEAGGMTSLGTAGFSSSSANGISSDGSVVVGSVSGSGQTYGFVWTEASGMETMGLLEGGAPFSIASAVSDEGTIVGYGRMAIGGYQAFFAHVGETDTLSGLGYVNGGNFSLANAITRDGSRIVGVASDLQNVEHAVMWVREGSDYGAGILLDGNTGWAYSEANDISADGLVVVGSYLATSDEEAPLAFRWTQESGAIPLSAWLTQSGVAVDGWALREAKAVSDDGKTIVGWGESVTGGYQAFLARAGTLIGTLDFANSMGSLQQVARLPAAIAKARVLNHMPKVTGMPGLSVAFEYDLVDGRRSGIVGMMLSLHRPGWTVSAGLGYVDAGTGPLFGGGRARYDGVWFGGGAALDLGKVMESRALRGLELSGVVAGQQLDANVTRGYLNGSTAQLATGESNSWDITGALRAGWRHVPSRNTALTPFVQVLVGRSRLAGYVEDGGAGAGTVSRQVNVSHLLTAGLEGEANLGRNVKLGLTYAFNHLAKGDAAPVAITLEDIGTFATPSFHYGRDWHQLGADLEWRPKERLGLFGYVSTNRNGDYPVGWSVGGGVRVGL